MKPTDINPSPYEPNGRFGPGQEIYSSVHKMALISKLYKVCKTLIIQENELYTQSEDLLAKLCDSLGLVSTGTKAELVARLDHYNFPGEWDGKYDFSE
jgi:hypothetical protein